MAAVHLHWSDDRFWASHPQAFFDAMAEFARFHGAEDRPAAPTREDYEAFKEKYAEQISRPGDGSL